jgi:mono/diheme cytochrome c family protein
MRIVSTLVFSVLVYGAVIFFSQCGSRDTNQMSREDRIKYKQYLVEGKRLYLLHCSNCHQQDGSGLARLYPPLKNSDYLENHEEQVICSIKYGQSGELTINNMVFNQPMPSNPRLTHLEIAEITTYVYSTWGPKKKLFTHQEVGRILDECKH